MKIKYIFLFLILICFSIFYFWITKILAKEDTSTSFPVEEAGIAAYTKLSSVTPEDLSRVGNELVRVGDSFVIVKINVFPTEHYNLKIPVNVYVGLDGWIVAYLPRGEPVAKIVYWKNFKGKIETNILKEAIDIACRQMNQTTSEDVRYYDFEFPEATKLTIAAERLGAIINETSISYSYKNDFYVTVPQIPYEASFELVLIGHYGSGNCPKYFYVNEERVVYKSEIPLDVRRLDVDKFFQKDIPVHFVCETQDYHWCDEGYAVAIVY